MGFAFGGLNMKTLIIICLIIAVTPISRSWSSPVCDADLSVTLFSPDEQPLDPGKSVSEIFEGRDKADPFLGFAETAETVLLKTVTDNLCAGEPSGYPVSIELTFIRLELKSSNQGIDRLRPKLSEMKGSYADVTVDRAHRSVKATIVWNPRRMLRDQLAVRGWKFNEDLPLLPLSRTEFYELRKLTYPLLIVEKGNMGAVKVKIGGTFPDEMYGLLIAAGKTRPRGQGTSDTFPLTVRWLIETSRRGNSAMTKAAIYCAFETDDPQPLISVLDIQEPTIRSLYQQGKWSDGIKSIN